MLTVLALLAVWTGRHAGLRPVHAGQHLAGALPVAGLAGEEEEEAEEEEARRKRRKQVAIVFFCFWLCLDWRLPLRGLLVLTCPGAPAKIDLRQPTGADRQHFLWTAAGLSAWLENGKQKKKKQKEEDSCQSKKKPENEVAMPLLDFFFCPGAEPARLVLRQPWC